MPDALTDVLLGGAEGGYINIGRSIPSPNTNGVVPCWVRVRGSGEQWARVEGGGWGRGRIGRRGRMSG